MYFMSIWAILPVRREIIPVSYSKLVFFNRLCYVMRTKNMPITSSAKKALRASAKKRIFNLRRKVAFDTNLKKFRKLVSEKKVKEAQALLPTVYQSLDKAVKTNY